MKRKRRRFIPPDKARAAVLGGFYHAIPSPGTFTCTACGEEGNSIGQADGICLRCRWTNRTKEWMDGYRRVKKAHFNAFDENLLKRSREGDTDAAQEALVAAGIIDQMKYKE